MAGTHRRAAGKRWSRGITVERYDAAGERLREEDGGSVARIQVRWRLDGRNRKATFRGESAVAETASLVALLRAAYEHDWPADGRYQPLPQEIRPKRRGRKAGGSNVVSLHPPRPMALPVAKKAGGSAGDPGVGDSSIHDVAQLVRWYVDHVKVERKRRGGEKRSPTTIDNYDKSLAFFSEIAVYRPGDPRLEALGLKPGASIRIDDPENGLNEFDLITALGIRGRTNLRVRGANERAMQRWAQAVAKEERRAVREKRKPVLPEAPELRPEEASARTSEAFGVLVKAMLTEAYGEREISYEPWTKKVDKKVAHPGPVAFTVRNVASQIQVRKMADAMTALERPSTDEHGKRTVLKGDRFRAFVLLAGIKGLRPEESIAVRDSWVRLDGDNPKIVLYHAEVYHPLNAPGGGRTRQQVVLKHRPVNSVRTIHLREYPELVAELRRHRELFVANPDPNGTNPVERDPYFFTSHLGKPIELSNWGPKWWKPTVLQAMSDPDDQHLMEMQFRQLRAAAITSWLIAGKTLYACAVEAGNSVEVIEKHYSGVLSEIGYDPMEGHARPRPSVPTDVSAMSDEDLDGYFKALKAERRKRDEE